VDRQLPAIVFLCLSTALFACGGSSGGNSGETSQAGSNEQPRLGPPVPGVVDASGVPTRVSATRIAFTNVTLVAMQDDTALPSQTVLVEDGAIAAIGATGAIPVPAGAEVIDGTDRYLMPGLADMHVHHVVGSDGEKDLMAHLAAGVTTVRVMWGGVNLLNWRARIEAGELTGPRLYVASPGLEGDPPYWPRSVVVRNESEARDAVRDQVAAGFDFIKVYNQLPLGLYDVIIAEAQVLGIPVIGHVPRSMSADYAINAGQATIEHFSGFAPHATTTGTWSGAIDRSKLAGLIEHIRLQGTWNCPTLTVRSRSADQVAALRSNPAFALMSESMQAWLDESLTQPPSRDRSEEGRLLREVLKALHDEGLGLLVGTDAGVQYVYPGFSIHEELANFVAAGLTPYETLLAATVNAAAALGESELAGTVTVGKRADLLLLDGNPLADVRNVNRRIGVMAAGEWYSQSMLMEMLGNE
jgi:imidazolonepropionase-like amidohydrolase